MSRYTDSHKFYTALVEQRLAKKATAAESAPDAGGQSVVGADLGVAEVHGSYEPAGFMPDREAGRDVPARNGSCMPSATPTPESKEIPDARNAGDSQETQPE